MSSTTGAPGFDPVRQLAIIEREVTKRSFCVLATSSAAGRPHAVGVMYAAVGLTLYIQVSEGTVKVRNVRENPRVAISIPVRKYPFGPPMAVQFQGTARVLGPDDPQVQEFLRTGRLKRIASLSGDPRPDTRYLEITPERRISSYGLGIPLRTLLRDVSQGGRSVPLP